MENNQMNQYSFDSSYTGQGLTLNRYMSKTFGWMFLGLLLTFAVAWAMAASNAVIYLFYAVPQITIILLIAEVAVVLIFSARIHKNSVGTSRVLFLFYSLLNGVVFSVYFVVFDVASLIAIFGLTALFFGGFALYGRFTRTDLSRLRPLLIGGLIFLVVASLLSLLIDMSAMERLICMAGIVIFLCFTAYDTQKIKANYQYFQQDAAMLQRASIYSALELYLDFINLFLYLLRFLGRHRN
ncbi:MAG TPA: Bax inhibitor-1/YccA family protein [Candidatus Enterenecus merdae]|nr:Bax inhibitor-1/YccA family protein [Candidatus Enterenecus merdae]